MKLYFYFLRSNDIEMEECEVIEKRKTYKPVTHFPVLWHYKSVSKEEINSISTTAFYKTVILTEPNIGRVSKLFESICGEERKDAIKIIQKAMEDIRNIENRIEMIKKWRENNE